MTVCLVAAAVLVLVAMAAAAVAYWLRSTVAGAVRFAAGCRWPEPEPEPEPGPKEPWRDLHPTAPVLSIELLEAIASPDELRGASLHTERLQMIDGWYAEEGPRDLLLITVDPRGRCTLADGHHRLVIGRRRGLVGLPVRFELVSRIPGHTAPAGQLLLALAS